MMKKLFCMSLVFVMLLSGCSNSDRKDSDDKKKSRQEKIELYDNSSSKSGQDSPVSAVTNMTTSQKNALSSAKSYLKYSAFSYEGLIEQLEYEGYPHEDCVFAVDNCGADWFDQAVKSAESYLNYSSFSYSELVDQLEYEGFTSQQAKHGADKAYGVNDSSSSTGTSVSKQNALSSAKSYLKYSAFSYEGLIEQLEYEGYPHEDCVYAVDNCGADWFEQAAKSAESYLKYSSFSYSELVDQLEYEGFTSEQAIYGAKQNGF